MDSRHVIRRIKQLTQAIITTPNDPNHSASLREIAENLYNPYTLCLPALINAAKEANIDPSAIVQRIYVLKNENKRV